MHFTCIVWKSLVVLTFSVNIFVQVSSIAGETINGHNVSTSNILNDPQFWSHFVQEVEAKSWSCNFELNVLQLSLEKDAALYTDDTIFRKRRHRVQEWRMNTSLWIDTVLGACRELRMSEAGKYTLQLKELRMLDALADYVDHLNFFQLVADKMESLGEKVKPFSQDSSGIHDIDKLDPVMLVGYSERFEDNVTTILWNLCVDRHTRVNPHHQAHCLWHDCCQDDSPTCSFCKNIKNIALREMVCDKVSRRVQKTLGGILSSDMWNVDISFFDGLPEDWLDEAKRLMKTLMENDTG